MRSDWCVVSGDDCGGTIHGLAGVEFVIWKFVRGSFWLLYSCSFRNAVSKEGDISDNNAKREWAEFDFGAVRGDGSNFVFVDLLT